MVKKKAVKKKLAKKKPNKKDDFEKTVMAEPAWDRRKEGYGIHGVELRFYLKGKKGAIQFIVSTGWYLPELDMSSMPCYPRGSDLGYHSPKPIRDRQSVMYGDCELTGGNCYFGGSGLRADRVVEVMIREGSEGVWREMEKEYYNVFGKGTEKRRKK